MEIRIEQQARVVGRHESRVAAGPATFGGCGFVTQQAVKRFAPRDEMGPVALVVEDSLGVDAEYMEDGRGEVMGSQRVARGVSADAIACAEHLAAGNARAGQRKAKHMAPVIAPPHAVDARRPAEFADRDDQRLLQQTAVLQVIQERREGDVELRAEHVLQPVGIL